MDIFDKATEFEEQERDRALHHRRPIGPEATGVCLNCERQLPDSLRWCDAECRDEWETFR